MKKKENTFDINFLIIIMLILIISVFPCMVRANQTNITLNSSITGIDIFPDSALIKRDAYLKLTPGRYFLLIDGIIENFDEKSIHIELKENADRKGKIHNLEIQKIYLDEEPEDKLRNLQEEISQLQEKVRTINSKKEAMSKERDFLDSIKNLFFFSEQKSDSNSSKGMPTIEHLRDIYQFFAEEMNHNYRQMLEYDIQIENLQRKIDQLQKKLEQITSTAREFKKMIKIDLEMFKEEDAILTLSYQIYEKIRWQPVYDIRADILDNSLEIIFYALLNQSTGVDWKDVSISLSTAKPSVSGHFPSIEPWFIRPYQAKFRTEQAAVMVQDEMAKMVSPEPFGEENVFIPFEYKGTNVQFNVPDKMTLESGTTQKKIIISSSKLDCFYQFKAYPKSIPYAYLNAFVNNKMDIPILPGEANIFLDGGFAGKTFFEYIPSGEDFEVSLGIGETVKVERQLLKKYVDETFIANIPSNKITIHYDYKIVVENDQNTDILCTVFENIPVAGDDRIQINFKTTSIEPKIKDWNDKKGIWVWDISLKPQQKEEIFYSYSISYPRDMIINELP